MSVALSIAAETAAILSEAVLIRTPRYIAGILPNCPIEERHIDESVGTEHPVEVGSPVTDHIYRRPPIVILRWGWNNSANAGILGASPFAFFGSETYVQEVYAELLALKDSFTVFNISTGKRLYSDMFIRNLTVETDARSEYSLMTVIECQNIIAAMTAGASLPSNQQSQQAYPQQTTSSTARGTQQLKSTPSSVLYDFGQLAK